MTGNIGPQPKIQVGTYRHYKGKLYKVLDVVCHSETLEWHVLYEPLYDTHGMPTMWVRPFDMFVGSVEVDGKTVQRFTPLTKNR